MQDKDLYSQILGVRESWRVDRVERDLFAVLAEFERDILRQRVNAGLKAARRRGRVAGLKKALALLRSGDYTKVQVAEELKVSRHTLWRALSQEPNP